MADEFENAQNVEGVEENPLHKSSGIDGDAGDWTAASGEGLDYPRPKKLVFDGGDHGGHPTNLALRERFPMGRVHIHYNRRPDGYVYLDNHQTKPMFFPDPAKYPNVAYFPGEEIPDDGR